MLTPTLDTIRLFLHILSASVWVGGQFVMAGVVPALRSSGHAEAGSPVVKAAANGFARVAWPAFAIAFFTGMWNLFEVPDGVESAYHATLGIKILIVVAAGVSAFVHARTSTRSVMAATGAIGMVASIVAMFFGQLLTTAG